MRGPAGWLTVNRVAATIVITLLALPALVVGAVGWCQQERPTTNGLFGSEIVPAPGPSTREAILLAQGYHLAAAVLWLVAASFAAGLAVGMAVPRRAGVWAPVAVAGFLGAVLVLGARPAPAPVYWPAAVAGGLAILAAAIVGGCVGQRLWGGSRKPPPAAPTAADGA
jgi:hypothetical protein